MHYTSFLSMNFKTCRVRIFKSYIRNAINWHSTKSKTSLHNTTEIPYCFEYLAIAAFPITFFVLSVTRYLSLIATGHPAQGTGSLMYFRQIKGFSPAK